jgi:hypothetical protein
MAPSVIDLFKAFLRYRWWSRRGRFRSVRRGDLLARVVLWLDPLARVLRLLLLVPAALVLALFAAGLGWALASGKIPLDADFLSLARLALFAVAAASALLPLVMGGSQGEGDIERFLLLPIPRTWLHRLSLLVTLAEPWHLMTLIMVLFLPMGMLGYGMWGAAPSVAEIVMATGLVLVAGLALTLTHAAFGLWIFTLVQRLLRDRRRAQGRVTAGLLVGIAGGYSLLLFLGEDHIPDGVTASLLRLNAPGELFVLALKGALSGRVLQGVTALAVLGVCCGGMLLLSERAYGRLLWMGSRDGDGRSAPLPGRFQEWSLPGVDRQLQAVAWVQLRTVWRTVPGKMAILPAPFLLILLGSALPRLLPHLNEAIPMELLFLGFAGTLALLGLQQFVLNTFAIDGPGLSLLSLLPLRSRHLLLGKGLAWGALLAGSLAVSTPLALALGQPGWRGALTSPLLGFLAMTCCGALWIPVGLLCSAVFPKEVALHRVTQANQPHALSLLIGTAALLPSWLIPMAIIAAALRTGGNLALAVGALLLWLGLCLVAGYWLCRLAQTAWDRRREGILLESQGR